MPSKSKAQRKTMLAAAHSPEFARKVGIPKSVGEEFVKADKERGKAALRKLPNKVATKRGNKWRPAAR